MENIATIKAKLKELAIITKIASQSLLGKDKIPTNPPGESPQS